MRPPCIRVRILRPVTYVTEAGTRRRVRRGTVIRVAGRQYLEITRGKWATRQGIDPDTREAAEIRRYLQALARRMS